MKKSIYILSLFAILGVAASCSEDLLDQKNPNSLTVTEFWKTEQDAQNGLNAAYAMFYKTGSWSRWMYFRYDLTSDEGFSNSPWTELADWTRFQYVNYNFWEGNNNSWRDHYKAVFRCNQVLANVPLIEFDATKKERILAQAKFLRAFYYFNMAILWEDVPLVLEPSEPDDLPVQNAQAEVWAQVEKDLTEASQVLPGKWETSGEVGRPTKGAALALLGKAHMQQHEWPEAKAALDYLVIGEGKGFYGLVPNYKDNFTHTNENNIESVFEIQFSDVNKGGDADDPNASMGNTRAQFFAPRSIGWSDGQARIWLVNEFKNESDVNGDIDERLRHTLFYSSLEADFGDKTYGRSWEWGADEAWFRKYQRDYYRTNEDYYSQINQRVIRYADILLLYAEVLNELSATADAYQYVNIVRARANMAPLEEAYPEIGTDHDKFLDRLKTERVLELAGESVRWMDLKRWGDLTSQEGINELKTRDPDFNNFVLGKHHRLPLPQIEVENNTNLNQNTPY
jgi:hypothetical protein